MWRQPLEDRYFVTTPDGEVVFVPFGRRNQKYRITTSDQESSVKRVIRVYLWFGMAVLGVIGFGFGLALPIASVCGMPLKGAVRVSQVMAVGGCLAVVGFMVFWSALVRRTASRLGLQPMVGKVAIGGRRGSRSEDVFLVTCGAFVAVGSAWRLVSMPEFARSIVAFVGFGGISALGMLACIAGVVRIMRSK